MALAAFIRIDLFALAILFVGLAIFSRGWRGRRIDDHPLCGCCRYDLHGSCGAGGELPERCPECGADPRAPLGVDVGNRERRPRMVWAGGTIAVVGLVWFLGVAVLSANAPKLRRVAPLSMAIERATPEQGPEIDGLAMMMNEVPTVAWQEEILRRLEAKELDPEQVDRVVARALEVQADLSRPMERWGDIFEAAALHAKVSNEQLHEYVLHVMAFELVARPKVRVGDPLPFQCRAIWRGSSERGQVVQNDSMGQALELSCVSLALGDQPLEPPETRIRWDRSGGGVWNFGLALERNAKSAFPCAPAMTGKHTMRVVVHVRPWSAGSWPGAWAPSLLALRTAGLDDGWEMELSTEVEIGATHRSVETVPGSPMYTSVRSWRATVHAGRGLFYVDFDVPQVEAGDDRLAMAFEVTVEAGGRSHRMPNLILRNEQNLHEPFVSLHEDEAAIRGVLDGRPGSMRITLTPSIDAALRTVDLDRIAVGDPIVLEAPIEYDD